MADNVATPGGGLIEFTADVACSPSSEDSVSSSVTETVDRDGSDERCAMPEPTDGAARPPGVQRVALSVSLLFIAALAALAGWLGFRAHQSHQTEQQRELFLQVGRQGAVNLTTIDFAHADTDIQRILNSATGTFYDDFSRRSQPFVEVVKQAKSTSVGTMTEAGLESESGNQAQVLVAVSVTTSHAGAAEDQPRAWRMRISVQKVGDEAKVSNVEFVP